MGAWPRWTMSSTGISATSQAPKEGSAATRQVAPAFSSISRASSTARVRRPTGNCNPTVFALRPRTTSRSRSVSPMVPCPHAGREKNLRPRPLLLLRPLDQEAPGRRELHPPFPEGLLRVRHMLLRRRDREDLRARVHASRRARRRAERRPHPFRDPVRAGSRRDLVLPENVVRIHTELEMVRGPGLRRDVPVRADAGGLEGDVPDLALLLREEMDLHRELRAEVPDVELADPVPGDAPHVLLSGVGLSADLTIHARRLARHAWAASKGRPLYNPSRGLSRAERQAGKR